jgi:hypothetical protein
LSHFPATRRASGCECAMLAFLLARVVRFFVSRSTSQLFRSLLLQCIAART